ncbi:class I SAM-dependent methyltransferase [Halomicroarcula limicola]|uniref:Class I SAM-dependent methyltransferase n=1 Tax=Haloarcula limicola TaxID=1429915 RepID=A0A8J8C793_9EURY|nr:class I SAM-dependent methyltransferase [Halomicroarcula limicola]MBV0923335.1 class I SAM-dependent methyltransferase [Halomicroarcula limicola]
MQSDVGPFDRFGWAYDRLMPPARASELRRGFGAAERDVRRVLDVGGGSGRAVRSLDVPRRIVVDAAPGMLRQARRHGLDTVVGDAGRLPVATASVDAVLIVDALHHMGAVDAVLAEARRVLRPGGVLVVREFDPGTLRGRALVAVEHLVGFESTFFRPDELTMRMATAEFAPRVVERGFGYTVAGVTSGTGKYGESERDV